MSQFKISKNIDVQKILLSDGEHSVLVVDNFLESPQDMVSVGRYGAYKPAHSYDGSWYPGVRDAAPGRYAKNLQAYLTSLISDEYFKGMTIEAKVGQCALSIIAQPPSTLSKEQYCPHTDHPSDQQFAAVLYLFGEPHGGTSLYRYRPRGLVRVSEKSEEVFAEMLEKVAATPQEHCGYLNGDTSVFERVGQVKAKFNRLVIFKANLLHSPDIDPEVSCATSFESSRFSVVTFIGVEEVGK